MLPTISDGEDKTSPFKNRLRKNYRHLRKWAKRTRSDCFRLYDRDIKEYPLAIDLYANRFAIHYFASAQDEGEVPSEMLDEVNEALISIFNVDKSLIFWRTRLRRAKMQQYEKKAEQKDFFIVYEYGVKFLINLVDYLDTGLFLDHKETRQRCAKASYQKRLLNLFAYTCSFSVHAAVHGAASTTSVDLSNTYTEWGKQNFQINHLSLKTNEIIKADCLTYLDEEIKTSNQYDVIIIDPPTISRSKMMEQFFDIQIDYIPLLKKALQLLSPQGEIYFSTNSRRFKFDESQFPKCTIREISEKTRPIDFRDPKIHRCWKLQKLTK
ncbi:MAG: class I SAM-dependent methyltransferase [Simkaniaceae bacterium]|nr:class I SAM-dependent methyltransferase [Simkaniaceae bacterium]MCF7852211.1 class I SAM-dependent methyltransferase [Simkaniaceae bacterium]